MNVGGEFIVAFKLKLRDRQQTVDPWVVRRDVCYSDRGQRSSHAAPETSSYSAL